jgi:prepilin-type N-terminal cleavage/methylation domain-containing protein
MRDDRGFTLVELLVAMGLFVIIMLAVLATFDGFNANQKRTSDLTEAQEQARAGMDRLARDMRNAVGSGNPSLNSVERAAADDLIFQTVAGGSPGTGNAEGRVRIRYCLDAANPAAGRLVRQRQTFLTGGVTAMPVGTACPGPASDGWSQTTVVAERITNRFNGQNRPVFAYSYSGTTTSLTELVAVLPTLFVDVTPGDAKPAESTLRSGVALRNANRPPLADAKIDVMARKLIMQGQGSTDPEEQPLQYEWRVEGPGGTVTATGVRAETAPRLPGQHDIHLTVRDPAGASNTKTFTKVVS